MTADPAGRDMPLFSTVLHTRCAETLARETALRLDKHEREASGND